MATGAAQAQAKAQYQTSQSNEAKGITEFDDLFSLGKKSIKRSDSVKPILDLSYNPG